MNKLFKYSIICFCLIFFVIITINFFIKNKTKVVNSNNIQSQDFDWDKVLLNLEKNANIIKKEDLPWNLILVNTSNKLPEDFSVKTVELKNGHFIDERAYQDLQNMMDSAKKEGLKPIVCSSLRDVDYQINLYNETIKSYIDKGFSKEKAEEETQKWVAIPGTSEHHTGLALDIVSLDYQLLDESQENTLEQKWLFENSYKYGFILRYPKDKTNITGISYEPWHYRYVGKEAAKEIFEQNLTLEEYIEQITN